jgi:hypothetical protein
MTSRVGPLIPQCTIAPISVGLDRRRRCTFNYRAKNHLGYISAGSAHFPPEVIFEPAWLLPCFISSAVNHVSLKMGMGDFAGLAHLRLHRISHTGFYSPDRPTSMLDSFVDPSWQPRNRELSTLNCRRPGSNRWWSTNRIGITHLFETLENPFIYCHPVTCLPLKLTAFSPDEMTT